MAYIKQNVQSSYKSTLNERNKSYLLALKDFLIDNEFSFVSEDYATVSKENITMSDGNTQYYFGTVGSGNAIGSNCTLNIIVSKMLDNGTTQAVTSSVSINLQTLASTIQEGTTTKNVYASGSTVLLVKNQNSFALIITSSANSITSSSNVVTGNIAYKLLDGTDSDISFVNSTTFTAIEKSQGNAVTFRLAHNKLNDDRLIYENKLSVNQSNMFVGDSDEIAGLVGAEKGKIYQTDKGKYFAFANDIAMLMGDEIL